MKTWLLLFVFCFWPTTLYVYETYYALGRKLREIFFLNTDFYLILFTLCGLINGLKTSVTKTECLKMNGWRSMRLFSATNSKPMSHLFRVKSGNMKRQRGTKPLYIIT